MSAPQFTPGPWSIESRQLEGKNDFAVSPAAGNAGFVTALTHGPDAEANACLIASAPELYEALDELIELARPNVYPQPDKPDSPYAKLERARAALAKARGDQ